MSEGQTTVTATKITAIGHGIRVGDRLTFSLPPAPWWLRLWHWITRWQPPVYTVVNVYASEMTVEPRMPEKGKPRSLRCRARAWMKNLRNRILRTRLERGNTMLAETTSNNERPDVEESYSSAAGTSTLKVEPHKRTPADIIIAAGMSSQRMGLALMRLRTEWDVSAKPLPPTAGAIEQIATTLVREQPTRQVDGLDGESRIEPNPHAGLVRDEVGGQERFRLPLVVAKELADTWHEHELKILLQQLKTLPTVREGLMFWAAASGIEDGLHIVVAVLLWWLNPRCPVCEGSGKRIVAGTGGRSAGKPCGECRKNPQPGERKVPHGWQGRKVLAYINDCRRGARIDLDGRFRHQRRKG